jgi:1,2-phenylacetyl-CoA epoxidase catalytic subunit
MTWDNKLMGRVNQRAGTKLRQRYRQEYIEIVKELGVTQSLKEKKHNETVAQTKLQRKHRKEYREIVNEVAREKGYYTAEMRRAKTIERREKELKLLKERHG